MAKIIWQDEYQTITIKSNEDSESLDSFMMNFIKPIINACGFRDVSFDNWIAEEYTEIINSNA